MSCCKLYPFLLPLLLAVGCSGELDSELVGRIQDAGLQADGPLPLAKDQSPSDSPPEPAAAADQQVPSGCPVGSAAYEATLVEDFDQRDQLPQSNIPKDKWNCGSPTTPTAAAYPKVEPPDCADPLTWKRDRIEAVAKKYLGLPYKSSHIPACGGLDCSNFTSWIYNYGLGIKFDSSTVTQCNDWGIKIKKGAPLIKGDVICFSNDASGGAPGHVGIWIGDNQFIHEPNYGQVAKYQKLADWYLNHHLWARRILE